MVLRQCRPARRRRAYGAFLDRLGHQAGADGIAAAIGAVWVIGRILYMLGYAKAVEKRGPGFAIQSLAAVALWLGATGAIVWRMIHG